MPNLGGMVRSWNTFKQMKRIVRRLKLPLEEILNAELDLIDTISTNPNQIEAI